MCIRDSFELCAVTENESDYVFVGDLNMVAKQAGITASGKAKIQWLRDAGADAGAPGRRRKQKSRIKDGNQRSDQVVAKLVLRPKGKKLLAQAQAEATKKKG